MTDSATDAFETVLENNRAMCQRCFNTNVSSQAKDSIKPNSASCGEDCGRLDIELEDDPIPQSEIEIRAERLFALLEEEGFNLNEEAYYEAISRHYSAFGKGSDPPEKILKSCIDAGLNPKAVFEDEDSTEEADPTVRITNSLLSDLPLRRIGDRRLETIDSDVADDIERLTETGPPVYYLSPSDSFPDRYRPVSTHDPHSLSKFIVEVHENWFWNASSSGMEAWWDELGPEYREKIPKLLLSSLKSRHRHRRLSADQTPAIDNFRKSSLWVILKSDSQSICAYLRRKGEPASVSEIADEVDLSVPTTKVLLEVLNGTFPDATTDDQSLWTIE